MIEFRDALTDITEEFGTDDGGFEGELPEGKHFRVENKNFYFDIGQNNRGVYMRISEVKTNFRSVLGFRLHKYIITKKYLEPPSPSPRSLGASSVTCLTNTLTR